ncbi:hypothetical protein N752_17950 [Desulforamulus aquiferis]|nr:hypothetical protein N752_17950 [Desulforamulus aquiferis]
MDFASKIRLIKDFPRPGINFRDITTLLQDGPAFGQVVNALADLCREMKPDIIACPEARGFVLGAPLAYVLGKGLVLMRKPGKLPGKTIACQYQLEYGTDAWKFMKGPLGQVKGYCWWMTYWQQVYHGCRC